MKSRLSIAGLALVCVELSFTNSATLICVLWTSRLKCWMKQGRKTSTRNSSALHWTLIRILKLSLENTTLWSALERWLLRMSNQLLWWKWFAWSRLVRFWIILFFWNLQASGIIITMKEKVRIRDLLLFSAFICIKIQVSDQTVKEKISSARSPKTRFPLEFWFSWNMWSRQIRHCHEEIKWSLNFSPSLNLLFFCLTKLLLLSNQTSPILFSTNKWSYTLHR